MTLVLWGGALGSGVMAGVYFTFSAFVMRSLAAIPQSEAVRAMQSINTHIVSSLFMPLFVGTSVLSVGVAIWGVARWGQPGAGVLIGAGVIYFVGMFVCTAAGNVPLNDALQAVDPMSTEAAAMWPRYVRDWTWLNHLRTVACTAACALFIHALATV